MQERETAMAPAAQQARGYITVTFLAHHDEETNQFVSRCVELGIASSGKDLDQAFDRIAEATCLYVNTLEEVGERERVFAEQGISITPGEPPDNPLNVRVRPEEYAAARNLPVLLDA